MECFRRNSPKNPELASLFQAVEQYLRRNYSPPMPVCQKAVAEDKCFTAPAMASASIRRDPALSRLLQATDAGFSETLLQLIDRSGETDATVYKRANLSKQHFSKIRNNPDYRPTKSTALALAVALRLDVEQTRDLIGRAGYALTNSSKADVIVRYFLEQEIYDLFLINETLYEFDQQLLGM